MRISLTTATNTYYLAGESGVSERVHSSAGDFELTAAAETQLMALLRSATAGTVDRGNLTTTATFTTSRVFATPSAAFLYALDHDSNRGREGYVDFMVDGAVRRLEKAVVSPPERRVIGCTVSLRYTLTGAGFIGIYAI